MKVGIIGTGDRASARERAVRAWPGATCEGVFDTEAERYAAGALAQFLERVDVVFVTVPTAEHFNLARAATKQGVHVFLEWPPATSVQECQSIIGLSEEAGIEVGVSRPLRFHPIFGTLPDGWRAALILLHRTISDTQEAAWPRWLADAVDLCCTLAQSSSVRRVDAEAVRSTSAWPDAVAFGLRYHNGTYAQVSIRRGDVAPSATLYGAGAGLEVDAAIDENDSDAAAYVSSSPAVETETHAFLEAVAQQRSAPVSILDGLQTMRLVEQLMRKLR